MEIATGLELDDSEQADHEKKRLRGSSITGDNIIMFYRLGWTRRAGLLDTSVVACSFKELFELLVLHEGVGRQIAIHHVMANHLTKHAI